MAQVHYFPRQFSFELVLDQLALFREGGFRAGYISGKAEITYDSTDDDWWISDIAITKDNGKCGADEVHKIESVSGEDHPQLYYLLLDRITTDYETQIEETIAAELAADGRMRAA